MESSMILMVHFGSKEISALARQRQRVREDTKRGLNWNAISVL